jgi:hypothetical protein
MYIHKAAVARSVGIVRLRTAATEFIFIFINFRNLIYLS